MCALFLFYIQEISFADGAGDDEDLTLETSMEIASSSMLFGSLSSI